MQSKRGPSVLQPYRDLAKLLRKASATSEHASWVFHSAPVASDNPYLMNHAIAASPYALVLPTHLLGAVAFFMPVLAENGRIPVDSQSGTIEISMIEESRVLEYSGRLYALVKWGGWMKLLLLSSVFMNVFVLPWGLGDATSVTGGLLGIRLLAAPHYDLHRLGFFFTPTPRHADLLLVTGPAVRASDVALRKAYEATADPKVVVAAMSFRLDEAAS